MKVDLDGYVTFTEGGMPHHATELIACDHCGLVGLDTPRFGWKRWHESRLIAPGSFTVEDGHPVAMVPAVDLVVRHHCPAGVEYNEAVRGYLVHMVAPEEAVDYIEWEEGE